MDEKIYLRQYQIKEEIEALAADLDIIQSILLELQKINESDNKNNNAISMQTVSRLANKISVFNRWYNLAKIGIPWEILIFLNQSSESQKYDLNLCQSMKDSKNGNEIGMLIKYFKQAEEITANKLQEAKIENSIIHEHYLSQAPILKKFTVVVEKKLFATQQLLSKLQQTYRYSKEQLKQLDELLLLLNKIEVKKNATEDIQQLLNRMADSIENFPDLDADDKSYLKSQTEHFREKSKNKEFKQDEIVSFTKKFTSVRDSIEKIPADKIMIEIITKIIEQLTLIDSIGLKLVSNFESIKKPFDNDSAILRDLKVLLDGYEELKNIFSNEKYKDIKTYAADHLRELEMLLYDASKYLVQGINSEKLGGVLTKLVASEQGTQLIKEVSLFLSQMKEFFKHESNIAKFSDMIASSPVDLQMSIAAVSEKEIINVLKRDIAALTNNLIQFLKNGNYNEKIIAGLFQKLNLSLNQLETTSLKEEYKNLIMGLAEFLKNNESKMEAFSSIAAITMLEQLWPIELLSNGEPTVANIINLISKEINSYLRSIEDIYNKTSMMQLKDVHKYYSVKINLLKKHKSYQENEYTGLVNDIIGGVEKIDSIESANNVREQIKQKESKVKEKVLKNLDKKPPKPKGIELPKTASNLEEALSGMNRYLIFFCGGADNEPSQDIALMNSKANEHLRMAQDFVKHCNIIETKFDESSKDYETYVKIKDFVVDFLENYTLLLQDYNLLTKGDIYKSIQQFYTDARKASGEGDLLEEAIPDFSNKTLKEVIEHYRNPANWKSENAYKESGILQIIKKFEVEADLFKDYRVKNEIVYSDKRKAPANASHKKDREKLFRDSLTKSLIEIAKEYYTGGTTLIIQDFKNRLTIDLIQENLRMFVASIEKYKDHFDLKLDSTDSMYEFKKIVGEDFISQHLKCGLALKDVTNKCMVHIKEDSFEGMLERMMLLRLVEIYGELSKIFYSYIQDFSKSPISKMRDDLYHLGMEVFAGYYVLQSFLHARQIEDKGNHKTDELNICLDRVKQTIQEIFRFEACLKNQYSSPIVSSLAAEFAVTYFGQLAHLIQSEPLFLQEASLLETVNGKGDFSMMQALTNLRLVRGELAHQLQTLINTYSQLVSVQLKQNIEARELSLNLTLPIISDSTYITKDVLSFMQLSWVMLKVGGLALENNDIKILRFIANNIEEFEKIFDIEENNKISKYERQQIVILRINKCAELCDAKLKLKSLQLDSKISIQEEKKIESSTEMGLTKFRELMVEIHKERNVSYDDYRHYKGTSKKKWDMLSKQNKGGTPTINYDYYDVEPRLLIAEIDDQIVTFAEHYTSGIDGNCGFNGLGIDREKAIKQLLSNVENEKVIQLVAPEIKAAFLEGTLPATMQNFTKVIQLMKWLQDVDVKKAEHMGKVKETLRDKSLLPEKDGMGYEDFMRFLKSKIGDEENGVKYLVALKEMQKFEFEVVGPFENELVKFTHNKETYINFVTEYLGKGGWLTYNRDTDLNSTSSMDAIAYINGIALKIWQETVSGKLECVHSFDPKKFDSSAIIKEEQSVDLIHTNGLTHFNFLETKSVDKKQESVMRLNK